jgi:antitoxin ParD1/3/4
MPTQNVNLPQHQTRFIRERVRQGRYQNASEVVRAGLRLLEQREAEDTLRLRALRAMARDAFAALDEGKLSELAEGDVDSFLSALEAPRADKGARRSSRVKRAPSARRGRRA